jgi:phage tail sheath protein FI
MAEFLSPGVFVEEVPSSVQTVQSVSTSNLGMIGAAERGPTDVATLITSNLQFQSVFGGLLRDSRGPLSMNAYFANGGKRAYYVRVAPADAVAAAAEIRSKRYDSQTNTGDGSTATVTEAVLTPVAMDPIVSGSLSFSWRAAGTPVVAETLKEIDGTTDLAGDAAKTSFTGRIIPASLPTIDGVHYAVDPGGTITVTEGGANTITLTQVGTSSIATGATGNDTATLDLKTGILHMTWGDNTPTAAVITLSYTPATETLTIVDDGAGALLAGTVLTANGTVTYGPTVAYSFTAAASNEPHDGAPIVATHEVKAWDTTPISVGTWANSMRIDIAGNSDFYTVATDSYTRFNVSILLLNTETNTFEVQEVFEELDFTDTAAVQYFADVVNDLSDYARITEPADFLEAPSQLNGLSFSQILAGGDGDAATSKNLTGTFVETAIAPRSVSISWMSGAVAKTVTDDGSGNLIGDVDALGTNTINYATGAFDLTLDSTVDADGWVTASYAKAAEESTHSETYGDTTKGYTAGTDGTYDAANWGRNEFSSPTLQSSYSGIYAWDRIEELMQVVVPDFAGDIQITKDLIDYVEGRVSQPSGGDRFAILTPPVGSSAQEAVDFFRFDLGQFSKYSAMYWPWLKVADPTRGNRLVAFPPVSHVAGIYARTDTTRNVGKSPGGVIDGALRFLDSLELVPAQGERDLVYSNKINPLISSPQTGLAVWGVRTLSATSTWRYINARRLFMFLEKSIFNSTHWIVFENNGPPLWARIRAQLTGFLTGLFSDGLFAGNSPSEAFFVIVDDSNNTSATINAGQVVIDIGVAPNKPAEFVRFRFQQKTLDA